MTTGLTKPVIGPIALGDRFAGCVLGTAAGDAIGLPREGMSARRAAHMFGGAPLRHRFLLGWGMVSDDTEHLCMTAQALIASGGNPERFARSLAWRLRWWLLGLPAGVGKATARAILKLWVGFPPRSSGVRSAGNGPAMRAAVIGLYAGDDRALMTRLVHASTRLTHTDPRAVQGALAVAMAAAYGAEHGPARVSADDYLGELGASVDDPELSKALRHAGIHLRNGDSVEAYAGGLGLTKGVSGYINHTVPVALYCWLKHPGDFRGAVEAAVLAGGDADTVGAIVGGIAGATAGEGAIPPEWTRRLCEWPRSRKWMRQLATRLAQASEARRANGSVAPRPMPLFWPAVLIRNLVFLTVVLLHGFRRLLPPY
jgi:ADP-ribosyl-[dinitrogen reductase] hydrolase